MVKTILLTFDLEEFVIPIEQNLNIGTEDIFEISRDGLKRLKSVLDAKGIKTTFFATAEFISRCPDVISTLIEEGHELAFHGCTHQDDYQDCDALKSFQKIKEMKDGIEKKFRIKIYGFRGPQLKHPAYNLLEKAGFKYDSSFHPTCIPGHYNNFFKSRKIKKIDGIIRIPISVTPFLRLPFSWFWFKNCGKVYTKICTKLALIDSNFINIYFHPWEFSNLNKFNFKKITARLSIRNSGDTLLRLIEEYITFLQNNNYKFTTIQEFLELSEITIN